MIIGGLCGGAWPQLFKAEHLSFKYFISFGANANDGGS